MKCIYNYKGKQFDNEATLNDYLLENEPLQSKYKDIVFDASTEQLQKLDKIESQVKDSESMVATYRIARANLKNRTENDDSYIGVQKPWTGTSEYMKLIRKPNGDLAFPDMISEELFARKYKKWLNGEFKDEQEMIDLFGSVGEAHPIEQADLDSYRKILESKWDYLHFYGTELHACMEAFFNTTHDGKKVRNFSDDFLINMYLPKKVDMSLLDKTKIAGMVKYARALEQDLYAKYGKDIKFYPEYKVTADTNQVDAAGDPIKLLGVIDLLIVDKDYNCHFIDYKASDKPYSSFDTAKILTYKYQFSIYNRLLRANNITMGDNNIISVAPIQMTNFRRNPNTGRWDFGGIDWEGAYNKQTGAIDKNLVLHDITEDTLGNININETVQTFLPAKITQTIQSTNLEDSDMKFMRSCFEFSDRDTYSNEQLARVFKKHTTKNTDTGKIEFRWGGKEDKAVKSFDTEQEVFAHIKSELNNFKANISSLTESLKRSFREAQKENTSNYQFNFNSTKIENKGGNATWLNSFLNRYANSTWEMLDCDAVVPFGILLFRNKYSGQIDTLKISSKLLKERLPFGKFNGSTLFANFRSDISEQSNTDSMALEAVNGNIELMESMFIINNLGKSLFKPGDKVGRVQVLNPKFNSAISASNSELLYNFNTLANFAGLKNNLFESEDIKMMVHYDLARSKMYEVVQLAKTPERANIYSKFSKFNSTISDMDKHSMNTDLQMKELLNLKKEFEQLYPNEFKQILEGDYEEALHPEIQVYNEILYSIAELKGYDFRQQLSDHDKWLNTCILKMHGTYTDNPGNLSSSTLNVVTQMCTEAYQNYRTDITANTADVRQVVEALKKDKNFSYLKETTFGNQVNLYKNILEFKDGDIYIKHLDDPTLTKAERDFAEYFLTQVNSRRYAADYTKYKNTQEYYQIPLATGGNNSMASKVGLLNAFKSRISYWNPSKILERVREYSEGFINENMENEYGKNRQDVWEMTNLFDYGFEHREDALASLKNPELNLETLLLKYMGACSMKENLDAVFPVIKASLIHLTCSGELQNAKFENDIQYLKDYVKNKIFNRSIVEEKWKKHTEITKAVMSAASRLCLNFSLIQSPYQLLDGIWKNISLVYRKPDGSDAFSAKNIKSAYLSVIKDMVHFGNSRTKCQLLNEYYALNDMDTNSYIDAIKTDRHGFWSFWSTFAYKFASRPDYYNRLTIFGAQMRGDGCWDAHSVVDGKLVYDWTKDTRFSAFAKGDKSNKELYDQQYGLYISTARQLIRERTKNSDGSMFKMGEALPKAYTTKQSEGYKSLSDKLYGYYAHEKKSMIHATGVGSMLMQMKTYWSGKKNQYLGPGGIYIQGKMVQKEENGQKLWYAMDKDGTVSNIPTTTNTGIPFMVWQGRWEEGIASTLIAIGKASVEGVKKGGLADALGVIKADIWNNKDENLRTAYRANIKQFCYDTTMWLLVGTFISNMMLSLYKDAEKDDKKNKTLESALNLTAIGLGKKIIDSSFDDSNYFKTLFGGIIGYDRGGWTPFSLSYLNTFAKNWWGLFAGNDKTFMDATINSAAFTKQLSPVLHYFVDPLDPPKTKEEKAEERAEKRNK